MAENTSNQEILRVTVNGNCSIFVAAPFEKYVAGLKEHMDGASSQYNMLRLEGYSDAHLTKKAEVTCKVTDCIKIAQFVIPD